MCQLQTDNYLVNFPSIMMLAKIRKVASNSTVTEVPEVVSKSSNMAPVHL